MRTWWEREAAWQRSTWRREPPATYQLVRRWRRRAVAGWALAAVFAWLFLTSVSR